jgi:hypothetical protein
MSLESILWNFSRRTPKERKVGWPRASATVKISHKSKRVVTDIIETNGLARIIAEVALNTHCIAVRKDIAPAT